MKKLIIIACVACFSLSAAAQQSIRLGNITLRIHDKDPASAKSENGYKYSSYSTAVGFGFIVPDAGSYAAQPGNSINLDVGGIFKRNHLRWFATGATSQYSYYNYRLRDINEESAFKSVMLGDREFARSAINKQVFRSHNIAHGVFSRFYLKPPENARRDDGFYVDLGLQGDLAFSKYYILKHPNGGKDKYRDTGTFNTFAASAVARIGWKQWSKNSNASHAFYFRYRFTNAFNQSVLPMDLPRLTVGVIFVENQNRRKR